MPNDVSFQHLNKPKQMCHNVRKRTFEPERPAKIQISLRIRTVWSEFSKGASGTAKDAKFLHADIEDSDQTARMRRLIWVFVGRTCQKLRFLKLWFRRVNTRKKQEAHRPRFAHLSDIATADMQMLCNIFPILSSQLMKISSFEQFLVLKKNIWA